jgi:hypothetical protein
MMKEAMLEYFKTLGMTEPILKRVEVIYNYAKLLAQGEEPDDVRVNEYVQDDGSRIYEDVIFYFKQIGVGGRDFLHTDHILISGLEKDVVSIDIESKDYDFKKATDKSRLNIEVYYPTARSIWKASKENCDHAMYIYNKYAYPSIRR